MQSSEHEYPDGFLAKHRRIAASFSQHVYPEGPVICLDEPDDSYVELRGNHIHMCPECFEDVPCDDWCTWDGESRTNRGVPTCHPVICERCETAGRLYHDQGGGI